MTQSKSQTLVNIISSKPTEDFAEFRREHITPEFIQRELENRERIDREMRVERQAAIDVMFPDRINGALYEEETIVFTSFDF